MTGSTVREPAAAGGAARRLRVDATWMRGGTSKCWIFHDDLLPRDRDERDATVLRLFGSPDLRQIDGVGGGSSTTSKAMVVDAEGAHDGYLEYEVGQVSVSSANVEWESNCGNCAAAVALYAVQEGLVSLTAPRTELILVNKRTGLILGAILDTPDAMAPPEHGDETVPGTVFPGVRVVLQWTPPSWSEYGVTLPTGNVADLVEFEGRRVRATLIDAGSPAALIAGEDLGLTGARPRREEVEALLPWLMGFRHAAARLMGLPEGHLQSVPKVGVVSRPAEDGEADIETSMVSMTEPHPAIGITSAVAVSAASGIAGTTVSELARAARPSGPARRLFAIGTPAGVVTVEMGHGDGGEAVAVDSVRSARRLADATLHLGRDWNDVRMPS